jgi:hypothetical protein
VNVRADIAPDLVIAGAARSGTSLLAAHVGAHPKIDGGAVKESNFFSRNFDNGFDWYDSYFVSRTERPFRLDASVSYTFPQYEAALPRLAEAAPGATVAYVVRDPVPRAVSHYLLNSVYFGHETAPDFGTALAERSFYLDVSDYGRWVDRLLSLFPDDQVVVVPFDRVKASAYAVAAHLCGRLDLTPPPPDEHAIAHQNNVVAYRSEAIRRATRRLRHSRAYPVVRRTLGPHLLRRIRSAATREPELPTLPQVLASCTAAQAAALEDLRQRVDEAVLARLEHQDQRLGLDWAGSWRSTPLERLLDASGAVGAGGVGGAVPAATGAGDDVPADQRERG